MTEEELMQQRGKLFRHFKGDLYLLLDIALHTEANETLVIYKGVVRQCGGLRPAVGTICQRSGQREIPGCGPNVSF